MLGTCECRSPEKAEKAAAEITKATGNDKVEAFHGDLSSLSQTRKLAESVKQAHPSLDVLINNAGDCAVIALSFMHVTHRAPAVCNLNCWHV